MAKYSGGAPRREAQDVVGVDDKGEEHVLPALVGGPGWEQKNPPPGSDGWREIVQAGVSSAAAADPPNEQELAIWRRVAEEQMPLDFVRRDDATLTLRVPSSWGSGIPGIEELQVARTAPGTFDHLDRLRNPGDPHPATADGPFDLTALLLAALQAAPFTVTVSRHLKQPVRQGSQYLYPWDAWGDLVATALEDLAAALLPAEDGVVVGSVKEPDLVAQALALLARARAGP